MGTRYSSWIRSRAERTKRLGTKRAVVAGLCLSMVGIATLPAAASAAARKTEKAKTCRTANGIKITNANVCKGLAFFKGKTMTWINIGSIGGPFDVPGIALGPQMQAYLGLAGWQVASYPTGSSIPGQDTLAHATPDGLTIGFLNPLADIQDTLEHTPGINFNPIRMAFIGATGISASPFVAAAGTGITSFDQVYNQAKTPGNLKMLYEAGSLGGIQQIWMGVMGLHPTYVSGYNSQGAEVTGLLRGDAHVGFFNNSLMCPVMQAGKAVLLASLGVPPPGTECRNFYLKAPTIQQLEKKYPPKTAKQKKEWSTMLGLIDLLGNPIVTQTSVPAYKLAALRAAVQWSYKQPAFKSQMLNEGQNPTYGNPVQAKNTYLNGLKNGHTVICYISGANC